MNHSLIPSLRFENYYTDWSYFSIRAFADIDKTSLKKDTNSNFEFSYISLSDVKNQKISSELERHIFNDAPSRARRIIKSGDILFSTVRPNLQGFALVCNEHKNCIASTGFAVISTDKTVNAYFIFQSLFTKRFADQVDNLVVGSNYPAISSSDVKALKIALPHVREQQKIASFLTSVDSQISQLTEKHRLLKEYKKGVMQQIFSQQLRFKDEDGKAFPKWKIERIGKYLEAYKELVSVNTEIPILTSSRTGLYPQERSVINEGSYGVVPLGYFTYRHMSDDLVFKFNVNRTWDRGAVSKEYPVFKTVGMDCYFLELQLNEGNDFKKFAIQQKQGGTRTRLYFKNLTELKLNTPCLKEQQKISQFLQSIDKKIDTVEQQVEQTKQFKKGLLQQMFV